MGYNFRPVERDQQYLLPVSLREWLPEDDLAWVVLDAVAQMDLAPIHARYRADGWGAPAFDPAMMVALLLYAYATGERSSRRIEGRCRRDIAYRVITANQAPDHATIARFRADHEATLGHLFSEILRLCAAAGLGQVGLVALDGTRLAAATSLRASRTRAELEAEIERMLAEAAAVDAAPGRGARRRSGSGRGTGAPRPPGEPAGALPGGPRAARGRGGAAPGSPRRPHRGAGRLHRRHWPARPRSRSRTPLRPRPGRSANPTDPDSRAIQGPHGWLQGYNAQAVVAEDGVIIAAELSQDPTDARLLEPMLRAARANLAAAGVTAPIGTLLADAGYWSEGNAALERADGPRFLISPTSGRPRAPGSRRPLGPGRVRMRARLADPSTRALYRRRATIVEPVFGQLKEIRGVRRLLRRRFSACASEWQLICATHNLLKLWRFGGSRPDGPPRSPVPRRSGGPGSTTPRQWRRGRVRGRRFTS